MSPLRAPLSPESIAAEIVSLKVNQAQQAGRIRYLEKLADTYLETPWWKRLWFMIDGWPGHGLAARRQWRPWHRR